MTSINDALIKLQKSDFRSKFHLSDFDIEYINKKGIDNIRSDAYMFVKNRLSPRFPKNDGSQTPLKGHPVFIAQHATACCCRGCLNKWYKVPIGVELSDVQQEKIVNLLMAWIDTEIKRKVSE